MRLEKIYHVFIIFVVTILFVACHSTKKIVQEEVIHEENTPSHYTLMNLSGDVDGVSFTAQVRIAHDSIVWVSANKMLEIGRIMSTPDTIMGYSTVFDMNYEGNYTDLSQKIQLPVTYKDIENILLGEDMPQQVYQLSSLLGHPINLRIKSITTPSSLTFPFHMPFIPER